MGAGAAVYGGPEPRRFAWLYSGPAERTALWGTVGLLTKWEFSTAEDGRKTRKKTPLASIQTLYHSLEV